MDSYMTVGEKAKEWGISQRHVQYLCRLGKIGGVVKRAGSWFISADTPSPAQNSKSNTDKFNFVGTRKRIFEQAIKLFVLHGFDGVSLRDIAEAVGIRQSTIYNHFKSKQEILDTIYAFYTRNFLEDRLSIKEMESLIKTESPLEIIRAIRYNFRESIVLQMSDITKIIFQRMSIDDHAKEISKSLMLDEGVVYVDEVFKAAIRNGRFEEFDTRAMSILINSVRIYTMHSWIADSSADNIRQFSADEADLFEYCAEYLSRLDLLNRK